MSWVYFARNTVTDDIKIGTAWSVGERLKGLARACGAPVVLVASARGDRFHETILHNEVWSLHLGHEWFRADRRLDRLAKSVGAGTFNFAAVPRPVVSKFWQEVGLKAHASRRARLAKQAAA